MNTQQKEYLKEMLGWGFIPGYAILKSEKNKNKYIYSILLILGLTMFFIIFIYQMRIMK